MSEKDRSKAVPEHMGSNVIDAGHVAVVLDELPQLLAGQALPSSFDEEMMRGAAAQQSITGRHIQFEILQRHSSQGNPSMLTSLAIAGVRFLISS